MTTKTVHQAVLDVMAQVGAVGKGSMQQGFAFRGIDAAQDPKLRSQPSTSR